MDLFCKISKKVVCLWEGLSVLESLFLKSFLKVQDNIFTVSLIWQWSIVLNVKLYLFYVQKQ